MLPQEDAASVLGGEEGPVGEMLGDHPGPVSASQGDLLEQSFVLWGDGELDPSKERGSFVYLPRPRSRGSLSMRGSRQSPQRLNTWSSFREPTALATLLQRM